MNPNTETVETQNANYTTKSETSSNPELIQELKSSQSLIGAVLGGFLGAIIGAAVWALITEITNYELGYTAIAVGFLAGFMVRKLGHGFQQHFGYIGAVWALLGCFSGNILATLIMASNHYNKPLMDIIERLDIDTIVNLAQKTFSPMDLLFYGIALYEGYKFSFMTKAEVLERINKIDNSKNH